MNHYNPHPTSIPKSLYFGWYRANGAKQDSFIATLLLLIGLLVIFGELFVIAQMQCIR